MCGYDLAVAVLAVTVAGLNQLGAPFFVEPLFNGAMLILAVGLAGDGIAPARDDRQPKPTSRYRAQSRQPAHPSRMPPERRGMITRYALFEGSINRGSGPQPFAGP